MENDVMEEINYGSSYKNITLNHFHSKAYYLKDIYGNGADINFYFNFNNTDIYNNDDDEIMILGFKINYDDIKYINDYDSMDNILDYYEYFEGKYEPFTKSGLITFDNNIPKNESFKNDIYYLFLFIPKTISEFYVEIFIDSNKNESQLILPKNKYIRGSFNLLNNMTIQSKIFYIQFENKHAHVGSNITYILEFSSNLDIIKPIFNNEFNCYNQSKNGGVRKYFFLIDKTNKAKKYNFSIQMNNTIRSYIDLDSSPILANYIIKFYKEENDLAFIMDKKIEFTKNVDESGMNSYYNFTIKNGQENPILNYDYEYTYYIHKYLKKVLYEIQLLNTTALIVNNDNSLRINYSYEYTTDNPNEEFSFSFSRLLDNEIYILYVLLKVSNKNNQDKYYSAFFQIETKVEKEDSDNNLKTIFIISIIFGSIFIITLIISIIVCSIYRMKNKDLKEQVEAISFSCGIGEEKVLKEMINYSKEDEDYETNFI